MIMTDDRNGTGCRQQNRLVRCRRGRKTVCNSGAVNIRDLSANNNGITIACPEESPPRLAPNLFAAAARIVLRFLGCHSCSPRTLSKFSVNGNRFRVYEETTRLTAATYFIGKTFGQLKFSDDNSN